MPPYIDCICSKETVAAMESVVTPEAVGTIINKQWYYVKKYDIILLDLGMSGFDGYLEV